MLKTPSSCHCRVLLRSRPQPPTCSGGLPRGLHTRYALPIRKSRIPHRRGGGDPFGSRHHAGGSSVGAVGTDDQVRMCSWPGPAGSAGRPPDTRRSSRASSRRRCHWWPHCSVRSGRYRRRCPGRPARTGSAALSPELPWQAGQRPPPRRRQSGQLHRLDKRCAVATLRNRWCAVERFGVVDVSRPGTGCVH